MAAAGLQPQPPTRSQVGGVLGLGGTLAGGAIGSALGGAEAGSFAGPIGSAIGGALGLTAGLLLPGSGRPRDQATIAAGERLARYAATPQLQALGRYIAELGTRGYVLSSKADDANVFTPLLQNTANDLAAQGYNVGNALSDAVYAGNIGGINAIVSGPPTGSPLQTEIQQALTAAPVYTFSPKGIFQRNAPPAGGPPIAAPPAGPRSPAATPATAAGDNIRGQAIMQPLGVGPGHPTAPLIGEPVNIISHGRGQFSISPCPPGQIEGPAGCEPEPMLAPPIAPAPQVLPGIPKMLGITKGAAATAGGLYELSQLVPELLSGRIAVNQLSGAQIGELIGAIAGALSTLPEGGIGALQGAGLGAAIGLSAVDLHQAMDLLSSHLPGFQPINPEAPAPPTGIQPAGRQFLPAPTQPFSPPPAAPPIAPPRFAVQPGQPPNPPPFEPGLPPAPPEPVFPQQPGLLLPAQPGQPPCTNCPPGTPPGGQWANCAPETQRIVEEVLNCPEAIQTLTKHVLQNTTIKTPIVPGAQPTLAVKEPLCLCCDSPDDLASWVRTGGLSGNCVQVANPDPTFFGLKE